MYPLKANTSVRVAVFNYFEHKGQIISAEDMDLICALIKDALAQSFQKAMLADRTNEIAKTLSTSFGLSILNSNINQIISDALMEVFKEVTK